jgi:hypothetical protein
VREALPVNLVHIGLPKAASTTLQNTVFSAQRKFAYIGKSHDKDLDGPLRELYSRVLRQDSLDYDPDAAITLLQDVREQFAAQNRPLLASHETLSAEGRADRRTIAERLHRLFAPAKVLIVLRRQGSMLQSQYMNYRRVPGGVRVGSFESWLDEFYGGHQFPDSFRVPLNYEPVVRTYEGLFGRDNVVVLPFELLPDENSVFTQRLAELLHMPQPAVTECLKVRQFNPRQSYRHAALHQIQSALPKGTNFAKLGRRVFPRAIYEPVRRFVAGGRAVAVPELPKRWIKRIAELCARGNAQLEARTGLPLGALGYPVQD